MAKNLSKERCVHCLKIPDEITHDHVIPKSWYSTILSREVRKPTAPSCYGCNQELGKLEKTLSHVMWACMPESHPMKPELSAKLYRACGLKPDGLPIPGLDDKEKKIRLDYLKYLLSMTESSSEINDDDIFPGFGYHANYPRHEQRVLKLNNLALNKVASKVVRGIEYIQRGAKRYVEDPYRLEIFFPTRPNDPKLEVIRSGCKIFSDGTNTIQRGASGDFPLEPIYIIRLWDQWEIWGVIMHKDREKMLTGSNRAQSF